MGALIQPPGLVPIRFDGTLIKWNDERGFGFIAPMQGGHEIFIHISSFPPDGRPCLNEKLSFEIALNNEGKKKAVNVQRPAHTSSAATGRARRKAAAPRRSFFKTAVAAVLIVSLGVYAYAKISHRIVPQDLAAASTSSTVAVPAQPQPSFKAKCDGRTHCSQMTSCAEATYFLKNCPGAQMDGNFDGVPCEQQWCTGFFAQ